MSKIICDSCRKQIKSKKDLVTCFRYLLAASGFGVVKPYHTSCFAKNLKTSEALFMNNSPVNGIGGTMAAFFAPFLGTLLMIVVISMKIINPTVLFLIVYFIAITIPLWIRLYSYFRFEKNFPR